MGILIKGMEMPTDDYIDIRIFPNGKAENARIATATTATAKHPFYRTFDVVEIPPHGRLIDADALCDGLVSNHPVVIHAKSAPTIIESEAFR